MDAFYVNVHLLDHPEDRGIPLGVGGRPDARGVLASASYEARQFGIRSAMPSSRALRLCPQLHIVPADWTRIRHCSREVMAILAEFGPLEQMSVDEAYLDLTAVANPETIAVQIKQAVIETTALPCSVGLATTKLVAKVASDHDKPDGTTIVMPGSEAAFLGPKPVRALWGIGPRTAESLAALNIHTCADLAAARPDTLQPQIGRQASDLIARALGIDPRPVQTDRGPAKSISQEWTFSRDVNDAEQLQKQLHEMCQAVARSLRSKGLIAHTVVVKFRWADFTTFTRQKSLNVGADSAEEIYNLAGAIFRENWPPGQFMRLLGVGVSNIGTANVRQLRLGFLENDSGEQGEGRDPAG
jgi:DNA polymerase-4